MNRRFFRSIVWLLVRPSHGIHPAFSGVVRLKNCSLALALGLVLTLSSQAQSSPAYGPPAIAAAGLLYAYSSTGTDPNSNLACDFYVAAAGKIEVDQHNNLTVLAGPYLLQTATYNPAGPAFYSTNSNQLSAQFVPVSADGSSFLGLPVGITVIANSPVGSMSMYDSSGTLSWKTSDYYYGVTSGAITIYYTKFMNLSPPFVFQVGSSPMYSYSASAATAELVLNQSSGTWPPSNLFPTPSPTIYAIVSGDTSSTAYSLTRANYIPGSTSYGQQFTYCDVNGNYGATLQLIYNFTGPMTGSVTGQADGSVQYTGTFDPSSQTFSNISDPTVQVSLSPISGNGGPGGNPPPPQRLGPPYISWDGTVLYYQTTDNSGNDYYSGASNTITVTISNGSTVSGQSPSGAIAETYSTTTSTFTGPDNNFIALDPSGNPIGLPTGLTLLLPSAGIGQSLSLSNNQNTVQASVNYVYQRPDGSFGVKYVSLPANYWFLIADATGNLNSQIYVTLDTSTQDAIINAVSGWPPSNAFPSQIYVDGTACPLNWGSNTIGSPGTGIYQGAAPYTSADNSLSLTLTWTWNNTNGQVTWAWSDGNGDSGSWDGVSTFSGVPPGMTITLDPPSSAPQQGPPALAWNGTTLNFDPASSQLLNADVYLGTYNGSSVWVSIDSAGNARIYLGSLASPAYTGTYNFSSQLFDFGTQNIGTLSALDGSNNPVATSSGNGNLDIPGNTLSLGSWLNSAGESVNGVAIAFRPAPSAGQAATLQFASPLALGDWVWSRSTSDGSTDQGTAMELDPAHRLLIYTLGGDSAAKIVLDPATAAKFQVPIRVLAAGDLDMQDFTHGPVPGQ